MSEQPEQTGHTMFAATRHEALAALKAFVPMAGRYASRRNHVLRDHSNVSRLSPAIRHGLLTLEECADGVRDRYQPSTVEKFLQELAWRRYWKSWLSMRPQVWSDYTTELGRYHDDARHQRMLDAARRIEAGESGVAIMNHFARELSSTGYLHNHARMWFAAWWVHVERLPWVLGADFFMRHLLDADAASNTLSWRWVAGLQTPGKTYLPRRSNLEKYMDGDLLAAHAEGLEALEHPVAQLPDAVERAKITRPELTAEQAQDEPRTGLWIHDEDLRVESGPLETCEPTAIALAPNPLPQEAPEHQVLWRRRAFADACTRASDHFGVEAADLQGLDPARALSSWARDQQLRQVLAMRPDVGPLDDRIEAIRKSLDAQGARLVLLDRPEHIESRPLATGGFFGYWKKVQARGWFGATSA